MKPSSTLLAGYGAVSPKNRPEDFHAMREAFEQAVAEEVIAELGEQPLQFPAQPVDSDISDTIEGVPPIEPESL